MRDIICGPEDCSRKKSCIYKTFDKAEWENIDPAKGNLVEEAKNLKTKAEKISLDMAVVHSFLPC